LTAEIGSERRPEVKKGEYGEWARNMGTDEDLTRLAQFYMLNLCPARIG
jgi:hypothetical protein